jgi:hypothetical protein
VFRDQYFFKRNLYATAMFHHAIFQLAFMPSWKEIVSTGSIDEIFSIIETRLNEKARKEHGLTLTIPFVVIDARRI